MNKHQLASGSMKSFLYKSIVIIVLFFFCDYLLFALLHSGMRQYFNLNGQTDVLCVGHSHTVLGINGGLLEKKLNRPVTKYAIAGANSLDRYWMIKHFLSINPDVSTVVYDVEARFFDSEELSSASYTLFLPFIDNPIMAKYLAASMSWQEFYTNKFIRTSRFRDQSLMISLRGLLNRKESNKTGQLRLKDHEHYLEKEQQKKIKIDQQSVEIFMETINELTQLGVQVILLYIPVADVLNQIEADKQQEVINIFQSVADNNKDVYFLDYNKKYEHSYELFWDLRHLNEKGKTRITNELAENILTISSAHREKITNESSQSSQQGDKR